MSAGTRHGPPVVCCVHCLGEEQAKYIENGPNKLGEEGHGARFIVPLGMGLQFRKAASREGKWHQELKIVLSRGNSRRKRFKGAMKKSVK